MIPLKDDNPTKGFPVVTVTLIAINVLVFVFELSIDHERFVTFVYMAGAVPYEITRLTDISPKALLPLPLTLFSSIFVHAGFLHLVGNMLYLWIFGDNIEDRLGRVKFILFYFVTGIGASLTHILIYPDSKTPLVGASGAVAGVLGAYFLLFPRAHVLTLLYFFVFVNVVRVPAVIFLGLWLVMQIVSSTAGGGIAWYAHIGGFVLGVGLIYAFNRKGREAA